MSEGVVTVGEIVTDIQAAVERMSVKNPHRRLLIQCGRALVQLASRLNPPTGPTEAVEP